MAEPGLLTARRVLASWTPRAGEVLPERGDPSSGCAVASTWSSPPGSWGLGVPSTLALSLPAVHSGSWGTSAA